MSLIHSPRIVTDGLKLVLDAGVPTSWNAGISTNWTDKIGGNNGTLVGGTYHNDGPFVGAGYVEFDGTGDTLTLSNTADHQFGSSDYTIESWVYLNNLSTVQGLFGRYNTSSAREIYITFNTNGSITHRTSSNGTSFSTHLTSAGLLTANTWHHVAISKSGTTSYIAVDGVVVTGTVDATLHSASQTTYIGDALAGSNLLNGNLSNYRILKGTALYTSNFTPPTKQLTAITNTTLLTCQGNTIADASSSAHTITANDNAAANLGSPASAFEFDGTDDYILLDSGLGIGTDDFAISVWVKFDSVSGVSGSANYRTVLSSYSGGNGYIFGLWISGDPVFEHYMEQTSYKGNTTIVAGTWYNMVSTRLSGDLYLYLNGSLDNTPVSASTKDMADTATPRIGWIPSASQNGRLDGTVSDLKIYKGKGLTAAEVTQNYNATKGRYA